MSAIGKHIIFYDSHCGFCNYWVQWILNKDSDQHFYFAPLGGENSKKLLPNLLHSPPHDTIVYWHNSHVLTQSNAILAITKKLPKYWKLLNILAIIPKSLRNWMYQFIAINRNKLGLQRYCAMPTPKQRSQFIS